MYKLLGIRLFFSTPTWALSLLHHLWKATDLRDAGVGVSASDGATAGCENFLHQAVRLCRAGADERLGGRACTFPSIPSRLWSFNNAAAAQLRHERHLELVHSSLQAQPAANAGLSFAMEGDK